MYYIGKMLQATGLAVVLIGFLKAFPDLMSYRHLLLGILIFACGWLTDRFLLKK